MSSRFLVGVFKIFGRLPGPPPLQRTTPPPDRPKFRSFFSLSRRKFHSFFSLWGVFSLNFGAVFEGWGAQKNTFGLSKTRTFERPGASNTTKIPREDPPRERRKNEISSGREKKSAKFWAPPHFGPQPFVPHLFWVRAPTPPGPHPSNTPPPHQKKIGQMRSKKMRSRPQKWPKFSLE